MRNIKGISQRLRLIEMSSQAENGVETGEITGFVDESMEDVICDFSGKETGKISTENSSMMLSKSGIPGGMTVPPEITKWIYICASNLRGKGCSNFYRIRVIVIL